MNRIDKDRIIDEVLHRTAGEVTYYTICLVIDEYEEVKAEYEQMTEAQRRQRAVVRDVQAVEQGLR